MCLVDSLEDLKRGIEYLNLNDIGKASFYFPHFEELNSKGLLIKFKTLLKKEKQKNLNKKVDLFAGQAAFIQTETKWKPFFEKILKNICIVDDLENAFNLYLKIRQF